jgi:hypothetical protein
VKGLSVLDIQQTEGRHETRMTFERARVERTGEAGADATGCDRVEIAARARWLRGAGRVAPVEGPHPGRVEKARLEEAPKHHQAAHLEVSGESARFALDARGRSKLGAQRLFGHEDFGRDRVAPPLGRERLHAIGRDVGDAGLAQPHVRQLVRERERLRELRVGAVHEDERREGIDQREAAELLRVETPVRVVPDDTVDHDEHARVFDAFDQIAERVLPGAEGREIERVEPEHPTNRRGGRAGIVSDLRAADERRTRLAFEAQVVVVPALAALAGVDRVEKIAARTTHARIADGAKVGDRNRLARWGVVGHPDPQQPDAKWASA